MPTLYQNFAKGAAGCSLFGMQSGKGTLHGQTYLDRSSWDVNSSKATAAWSSKLAQALTCLAFLEVCPAVTSSLLEFTYSCYAAIKHSDSVVSMP